MQTNTYNLLGESVKRFIHFEDNNNLNELFDDSEQSFIKEMPLAKTTFADIKSKIQSHFNKNIPTCKENIDFGISDILLECSLEKKLMKKFLIFIQKNF